MSTSSGALRSSPVTPVLMFPGQTTRDPQMLERALRAWPEGKEIVTEASRVLDRDIRAELLGPDPFSTNRTVQVAVFLTSHVHMSALESLGLRTAYSVGLSLGEYNHLHHIGAMGFADAIEMIDKRGECFDLSPRGNMVAVVGIDHDELMEYLAPFAEEGVIDISNHNGPTQHVVAGEPDLMDRFVQVVTDRSVALCVRIEDRLAMHTPLLDGSARAFAPTLAAVPWSRPRAPYRPGTDPGAKVLDPEAIPDLLVRHASRPVHFQRCLDSVLSEIDDPLLVETGCGNSLTSTVKRFRRNRTVATESPDGMFADFVSVVNIACSP